MEGREAGAVCGVEGGWLLEESGMGLVEMRG
jgi:hypothetical protein